MKIEKILFRIFIGIGIATVAGIGYIAYNDYNNCIGCLW